MHWPPFACLLAASVILAGCDRPKTRSPAPTTTAGWLDDGKPQTGLPRLKVYVGPQVLDTELALTPDTVQKGMMWRTNVADSDAMLFVFARKHRAAFWMKNVPISIDVAYLDPDGIVLEIHRLERQSTNSVEAHSDNVQFALETAEGWFERHGLGVGAAVRTERGSLRETFFSGNAR